MHPVPLGSSLCFWVPVFDLGIFLGSFWNPWACRKCLRLIRRVSPHLNTKRTEAASRSSALEGNVAKVEHASQLPTRFHSHRGLGCREFGQMSSYLYLSLQVLLYNVIYRDVYIYTYIYIYSAYMCAHV